MTHNVPEGSKERQTLRHTQKVMKSPIMKTFWRIKYGDLTDLGHGKLHNIHSSGEALRTQYPPDSLFIMPHFSPYSSSCAVRGVYRE